MIDLWFRFTIQHGVKHSLLSFAKICYVLLLRQSLMRWFSTWQSLQWLDREEKKMCFLLVLAWASDRHWNMHSFCNQSINRRVHAKSTLVRPGEHGGSEWILHEWVVGSLPSVDRRSIDSIDIAVHVFCDDLVPFDVAVDTPRRQLAVLFPLRAHLVHQVTRGQRMNESHIGKRNEGLYPTWRR